MKIHKALARIELDCAMRRVTEPGKKSDTAKPKKTSKRHAHRK